MQTAEIEGFRKGKAPRVMVEGRIDRVKFNEEILRDLLPKVYSDSVKEHNIIPIVNPKIEIVEMAMDKDWIFKATTSEKPNVTLGDYKDKVKTLTAKSKIVIPGKEQETPKPEEVLQALVDSSTVEIGDMVIDAEVDRMLSHLLSEIKALGLTLEQYLGTVGKTPQSLRDEYKKSAEKDLKLEFILEAIADEQNITVAQAEVDTAILGAKNEDEKKALESNPYMLASILRRQKTLDYIMK